MATRAKTRVLTDHEEIREWAEERGAQPARVRGTGGDGDVGMIRLDFPGYSGEESLEPISWDEWFQKFDESNLALLVQDETASGQKSNFNKLIGRETAEQRARGVTRASRRHPERARATGARASRTGGARRATGSRTSSRSATSRASRSTGRSSRSSRSAKSASSRSSRSSGSRRSAVGKKSAASAQGRQSRSTRRRSSRRRAA